jgi:hypothetical protein
MSVIKFVIEPKLEGSELIEFTDAIIDNLGIMYSPRYASKRSLGFKTIMTNNHKNMLQINLGFKAIQSTEKDLNDFLNMAMSSNADKYTCYMKVGPGENPFSIEFVLLRHTIGRSGEVHAFDVNLEMFVYPNDMPYSYLINLLLYNICVEVDA